MSLSLIRSHTAALRALHQLLSNDGVVVELEGTLLLALVRDVIANRPTEPFDALQTDALELTECFERDPNEDVRAELEALRSLRREVMRIAERKGLPGQPSPRSLGIGSVEWSELERLARLAQ